MQRSARFVCLAGLVAAALFACPAGALAATTVIGTVKDASGTVLSSGTIVFTLSQEGIVTDPAILITPPVKCDIVAGVITACSLRGNDEISPAGTVYRVRIQSTTGRLFMPERTYSITGTPWDIGTQTPNPSSVQTGIHGASLHSGDVIPAANQEFGAFYSDFGEIAVPANPGANVRRVFVNSATGEISVRTSAGTTVSLESGGGGGATHQIDAVALTSQDPINFLDTSIFDWTNPAAGNLSLAIKAASLADSLMASSYGGVGACAANNFETGDNDDAAPSCAQPAFTNLSGSATLAQLPFGAANQVLGTNAGATAIEHKSLATGTAGTDVGIVHTAGVVTFNIPIASAANTGKLSSANWSTFNAKEDETHASDHQHGGADEVATATPGANAIPKAGAGGILADGWVDGSAEADELVLAGDVDGTANANDIDETAVEAELEAVLDLADLQEKDIDSLTGQANWGTAVTKETADLIINGVEVDFEAGASEGYPRIAQSTTPPATGCDVAAEIGRLYFDTDADTDGSLMVCAAGPAWKEVDDDGAGGGEANTHSSDGGGLSLTAAIPKVGVDLRLTSMAAVDFDLAADLFTIDDTKWAKDSELHTIFSPNADPGVDHSGLSGGVGITEVAGALSFDATEIGTETWLDNADRSWTFDIAAAGTNPVIAFSSGIVNLSTGAWQEGGNAVPNSTDALDFFASTTSVQLRSVLSDEVGNDGGALFAAFTSPAVNDVVCVDGVSPTSLGNCTLNMSIANEGVTGTTLNKLAKLTGAPSTAIIASAGDTGGVVGLVVAGAGTAGSAELQVTGIAQCDFDGATTAGNYVQVSNTVAGECTDAGATYPSTEQVIGIVSQTIGAAGLANVVLFAPENRDAGGGGGASTADAFVTVGHPADLTAERNLAAGDGVRSVDGGANNDITLSSYLTQGEGRVFFSAIWSGGFGSGAGYASFGYDEWVSWRGTFTTILPTDGQPATGNCATGAVSGDDCLLASRTAVWRHDRTVSERTNLVAKTRVALQEITLVRAYANAFRELSLDGSDDPVTNFAAFRFSTAATDTNWQCISNDGTAGGTITDSTIAVTAGQYYELRIIFDDSVPNITFQIDGTTRCIHTTNLPTDGTNMAFSGIEAETLTTAARNFRVQRALAWMDAP